MKKEKFKIKSRKRIFFGSKFIALMVVVVLLVLSSTYAMFSDRLLITGTVIGDLEYTYYFRNSQNWSGDIYAHIYNRQSGTDTTYAAWPGTKMNYDSSTRLYSVTFSGNVAHNYIVFNNGDGGGSQTSDISINPLNVNRCVYDPSDTYNTPNTQRLSYTFSSGTPYAYLFNGASSVYEPWPGINISGNTVTVNTYSIEINKNSSMANYKYIIFNNNTNSSSQTPNLVIPIGDNLNDMIYSPSTFTVNVSGNERYTGNWYTSPFEDTTSSGMMRIYFLSPNTNGRYETWPSTPNVYLWKDGISNASWPGESMIKYDTSDANSKVFYKDIPIGQYDKVIFNDTGSSKQTVDIDIPSSSNKIYMCGWSSNTLATGGWSKVSVSAPTPSHSH